jgi:hypothetical protein
MSTWPTSRLGGRTLLTGFVLMDVGLMRTIAVVLVLLDFYRGASWPGALRTWPWRDSGPRRQCGRMRARHSALFDHLYERMLYKAPHRRQHLRERSRTGAA